MRNNKKLKILKNTIKQFRKGMDEEKEHGDQLGKDFNITKNNKTLTAKIVGAHLKKIPDYYDRLEKLEKSAEKDEE
jgi:predicted RNase H-like nuclease (RuvC/YqgF family)